ncbi:hypothetical protein NKR19_g7736, partial [Coniochaeta hoffmannii]
MLLRQPASDPDIFTSMSPTTSRSPSPHSISQSNSNNDLDDIWGSSPSSPTPHPSSSSPSHQQQHHPSDIPRLQQEHATAGYRDGIAAAKAGSAQAGFDEGFGLGAVIGARAGRVLGVLEGLSAAAAAITGDEGDERERLRGLLEEAGRELGVVSVFGREYWDGEGVWRFQVGEEEEED